MTRAQAQSTMSGLTKIDQPAAVRNLHTGWLEPISTEINTLEGNHAHDHA